jgi:ABC-type Zn uptake system ZnuABC Zn-binding protein ZnuA
VRLALMLALLIPLTPAAAADRVRVVATIPDLKALVEAVGSDLVEVESLVRPNQNPHDLEVRPSLMVRLRRADLLVVNGLDLDGWAEAVIRGANNPRVVPGAPGFVDASRGVPVLEVPTGRVDRSMGDVHPLGNPHYTLDPGLAGTVTQTILDALVRAAPAHRAAFERQRQAFLARLEQAMGRWTTALEPVRRARIVVQHNNWLYFFARFGLRQVATIEERPGIPPSPAHLARLIRLMREGPGPVVVVAEPWGDQKLAARVAQDAGARLAMLNARLGVPAGPDAYLAATEANVAALAEAAR